MRVSILIKKYFFLKLFLFVLLYTSFNNTVQAQCPSFLNGSGVASNNPYWISCTGGAYTLFLQPTTAVGAYTIDFGDGSAIVSGTSIIPPAFLTHVYPAAVDTFIVTITETSSGCITNGVVVMETTPSASIQIPAGNPVYGCTPANFSFINASTNVSPTTTFTWDFGDGSPILSFDYNNHGQTISHIYPVGTADCNIEVTLTATNYCNVNNPSVNNYYPIQVWDRDVAQITANPILLCFPDNVVHYDNTTTLNCWAEGNQNQRYEFWNFGNYWGLGYDSIVNWQPFNPPARPGYDIAYPGLGNYSVMLVDSNFCGRDTSFINVSIVNPPTALLSVNNDTICQGSSITFSNNSIGGANLYYWNFGDGTGWSTVNNAGNMNHTYNIFGDFTVQLVAVVQGGTPSCRDTTTINIHVKESPQAIFSMDNPAVCDSGYVSFTDLSVNAAQYFWNFANGNTSTLQNPPTQFYNHSGNYNVSLLVTHPNGCTNSSSQTVRIYASPIVQISPISVCEGVPTQFFDLSTTLPGDPAILWNWNFGDATPNSNLQNPTHSYNNNGSFDVILNVATLHCSNKDTIVVTVYPLPDAGYTENLLSGCTPLLVNFTSTAIGAFKTWYNFGDGTPTDTAINTSHSFINLTPLNRILNVSQIVQNIHGCLDTVEKQITVFPGSHASFVIDDPAPACSPVSASFTNNSTGALSYIWNFGDGSPLNNTNNPTHLFLNTTPFIANYIIKLVAISSNGCSDSTTTTLTVYPQINISVDALPLNSGCHPFQVQFQSSSAFVTYDWDFDDGDSSNLQNPLHTFINTTSSDVVYNVSLTIKNPFNCSELINLPITVHPLPTVSFDVAPIDQTFPNNSVIFSNIANNNNSIYNWDFGDSFTSNLQNPINHNYTNWGSYAIELLIKNLHCQDSTSKTILIRPPLPIANFTIDPFEGCEPLMISTVNNSQYSNSYIWNFADGETSTAFNPSHTYFNDGTYTINLIAIGDGGIDTSQANVVVYKKPTAFFTAAPTDVFLPSDVVKCYNLTTDADYYNWNFGDGVSSSLKNPEHLYTSIGEYQITLIASNDKMCIDTFTLESKVNVNETGEINFPNAFVPNPSGSNGGYYNPSSLSNDVFFPIAKGVTDYKLFIFNKWGELIFESNDYKQGWDGYFNGKLCQQDVYIWKVQVGFSNNKTVTKVGNVTLLH